jgi:pimeloyl-ACP methyl ester carboxylesterase
MRNIVLYLILHVILISACVPQLVSSPVEDPGITLTDCVLKSAGIQNQVDAKCGSLTVSEDPSNPQSAQIELSIAVVEAISRSPEPDPLFILVGGPGQSALETFPAISPTLFNIHEARDIVLVDQRGTGSSNPLRCLDPEDETLETLDEEQVIARMKQCPEKLDADLRFYTTDIAMQDLERVRSTLVYESINLYGVSYGTRAALVYLKMYPARVRSAVLDAVVDPAFVLYQDVAQDGGQSLELFFKRCEADTACNSTYPRLRSEFEALLGALEEKPVELTIPDPVSGKPLQVTITETKFANIIFNTLYAPDLVAMLPLAIHQAYSEDNYAPLITQAYLLNAGIYDGMFYAVACSEDAPLVTGAANPGSIFGSSAQDFVEVCAAWPRGEPAQVVREPVVSDAPVLMLSGEADPITPPWHADQLTGSLSNSLHLIFAGMGHGNAGSDCTRRIIDSFIETGSISGLDTSCVQNVEPPPFFVDFSGPQP